MSLFTPPVEDFNKRKIQNEAESMFIDLVGDAMLNSNMPEEQKINIRVLLQAKQVKDKLGAKLEKLCDPKSNNLDLYAKRKEALQLLQKINAELDSFNPVIE